MTKNDRKNVPKPHWESGDLDKIRTLLASPTMTLSEAEGITLGIRLPIPPAKMPRSRVARHRLARQKVRQIAQDQPGSTINGVG